MRTLLRWLIFTGRAPNWPWLRRFARRHLQTYTIYGDSMLDLGLRPTEVQRRRLREWIERE